MLRGLLILLPLTGAVLLRGPVGAANGARRTAQFRYSPDARVMRLTSLGHRSTLANLLWLKAIPDLSREFPDLAQKQRWLEAVFDTITDLDPEYVNVYRLGATYLAMVDRDPDRAIELLETGVEKNPERVELRIDLAMAYFMHREDRENTIRHLEVAVADPGCDAFTKGFYSSLLVDDRSDYAALAQWLPYLEHDDVQVRDIAELYLERARRRIFLRALHEYEEEHGQRPPDTMALRDERYMAEEVFDAVLSAARLLPTGRPSFPRLDELERRHRLRAANQWSRRFHFDHGRWPTLDEILDNPWVKVDPPPPGQEYHLEQGALELRPVE